MDIVVVALAILAGLAVSLPTKRFRTAAIISIVLAIVAFTLLQTTTDPEIVKPTTLAAVWSFFLAGVAGIIVSNIRKRSRK